MQHRGQCRRKKERKEKKKTDENHFREAAHFKPQTITFITIGANMESGKSALEDQLKAFKTVVLI